MFKQVVIPADIFKIGDKAWRIIGGKAAEGTITGIHILETIIYYAFDNGSFETDKAKFFKTKEALITYISN